LTAPAIFIPPMPDQPSDLAASDARYTGWLLDSALPLWFERGIDWQRGGFFERLDQNSAGNTENFKRLRVLARQIYVFAQGVAFGWDEGRRAVTHGVEFLFDRARRPDGGYALRFDLDGHVVDDRRDLYDLAFVLLGLAHAYRVDTDIRLREAAIELMDYLHRRLGHAAGGFCEGIPATLPRRHNGHMHLLEALLACGENGWGEPFAAEARHLVDLFARRFYDAKRNFLAEAFDDALAPLPDGFAEPGHYYEWSWLLDRWARANGLARRAEAGALYGFARRYGADSAADPVRDALWPDGGVKSASARLWPQAERVKAALGREHEFDVILALLDVFGRYLQMAPIMGLWRERRLGDGTWSDEPAPASSLYHIVAAVAEVRRSASPPAAKINTPAQQA
jgi:mannose/cellobiose epimerase-like protein (N-acyl-D-glucosamine 2-epimerase family)